MPITPLRLLMGASGAIILTRAIVGPFHLLVPVNSPLNLETAFALALMACIALGASRTKLIAGPAPRWLIALVLVLVVLSFVQGLPYYFISDDYFVLHRAREFTLARVPFILTHCTDCAFFRPIGDLSWYLQYPLSGTRPAAWHGVELTVHTLNCALVYLLFSAVFASRKIGLWTAAFFGLHPANTEAVSYLGAGEQILFASVFVLSALVLFVRYCRRPSTGALVWSLFTGLMALWSKESAYVLPLLAALIAWRMGAPLRKTLPYWILTAAAFVYRWILIGGIGGYQETHATPLGTGKALGMRIWAILAIPVNWSTPLEIYAIAGLAAGLAAYMLLPAAGVARKDVCFAVAWIVLCALPAIQLLLIGSNLLNSRLLYLSTAGFGMLLACAVETLPRLRLAAGMALVFFFVATIQHNLTIWAGTSELARQTCTAAAAGDANARPSGEKNGVWFFANGFPECVAMRREGFLPR
jgi:hypothetical protein